MMNVTRIVVSDNKAGIENDHHRMKLSAINDAIDLFAEPFVAVGVFLWLKVLEAATLGVRIGAGQICLDCLVNHFADRFASEGRLRLQSSIHFVIDIPNGCIHGVLCNTSVLLVQWQAANKRDQTQKILLLRLLPKQVERLERFEQ